MIVNRILQLIKYKGINKRKFYIETGLSNGFLDKVKDIGASKIEQILTTYPDINPEWLLTGNGNMTDTIIYDNDLGSKFDQFEELPASYRRIEKQQVPLYNVETSTGISLFEDLNLEPIDYITVPNLPKCDGAIYANTDSMYPLLRGRDIILYKKIANTIDTIFWGEMYIISLTNNDLEEFILLKWIQKSAKGEDWIKLVSENPQHESKDVLFKNIKGLAVIKASIRINPTY
ncbi:helix-turn-helix transcriptional regulator [Flavobacterium sp. FlaQc-57]|uniref:S24 family peptidase n=1 Tax=Flavobacterium sp. FlaQc-57 TaxID=3374186 RepID=UPI003757361E